MRMNTPRSFRAWVGGWGGGVGWGGGGEGGGHPRVLQWRGDWQGGRSGGSVGVSQTHRAAAAADYDGDSDSPTTLNSTPTFPARSTKATPHPDLPNPQHKDHAAIPKAALCFRQKVILLQTTKMVTTMTTTAIMIVRVVEVELSLRVIAPRPPSRNGLTCKNMCSQPTKAALHEPGAVSSQQ